MPTDVVPFQTDVFGWGWGGRVKSGTISSITIDQPVTLAAGKTYSITIRQQAADGTDVLETRTITNSAGTYTVLNVTPNFSYVPAVYSVYTIYEVGTNTNLFRVAKIGKTKDNEVEVVATLYSAQVYSDTGIMLPMTPVYTVLPNAAAMDQVDSLTIAEIGTVLGDGTWVPTVQVGFQPPQTSTIMSFDHAEDLDFRRPERRVDSLRRRSCKWVYY